MAKSNFKGAIGGKEIVKALKKRAEAVSDALEPAARAGGEVIQKEAKRLAPERTGNLADHIELETLEVKGDHVLVGVGPDDEKAWYGFLVEFGTGQHRIERDTAQGLEVDDDQFAASAEHHGARAQPFMRPALDNKAKQATEAMAKVLKDALGL